MHPLRPVEKPRADTVIYLDIPTFLAPPAKPPRPAKPSGINKRLVAAVRWDYETGMLSWAQMQKKYSLALSPGQVRGILAYTIDPDIKPARSVALWRK